jgi:flagellar FliJ protein
MATHSTLDTLIDISEKEIDRATLALSEALRAVNEMAQKLTLLQQYQNDYVSRFQTGSSGGLTASGYRNYQSFLDKLDLAITGQSELLRHARVRADEAQSHWLAASRKQKSFTTLAARATSAEQKVENRRDQKMNDEYASRITGNTGSGGQLTQTRV